MVQLLFVYGSLKEGFPNHPVNRGRRRPGTWRTTVPYPLWLADGVLPCLLARPGEGLPVSGQLFEVGDAELAAMDALERVGEPDGYACTTIEAQPLDAPGAPSVTAYVYVQDERRLAAGGAHLGPLAEYLPEHARSLRW